MRFAQMLAMPFLCLAATAAHGQVAAAAVAAAAPHLLAAAPAVLSGAVSSGSAHVGQAVLARLSSASALSDGTKLPAGTQLLGHLTQVKPLAQGAGQSSLGMVFDHFKAPGGTAKDLGSSVLQSIGSGKAGSQRQSEAGAQTQTQTSASNPVGGLLGGVTGAVGSTVNTVGSATTSLLGTVTSLPGVLLNSTGTLSAQGKDVQVPAGTRVSIAASASAETP